LQILIPIAFTLTLRSVMTKAPILIAFCLFLLTPCLLRSQEDVSAKYVVYLFLSDECPICQYYTPTLNEIYDIYQSDSIQFIGIFPNFASKPKNIDSFIDKYKIKFPTKTDYFKSLTSKFSASVTPEVVVYDQQNQTKIYQGRIDNSYVNLGKRRRVVTEHELQKTLGLIVQGKITIQDPVKSIGCFINMSDHL